VAGAVEGEVFGQFHLADDFFEVGAGFLVANLGQDVVVLPLLIKVLIAYLENAIYKEDSLYFHEEIQSGYI
jgi:hypothetical protein